MKFDESVILDVQKQVDEATEYEHKHKVNSLLHLLKELLEKRGHTPDLGELQDVADFIEIYIQHSPAILLAILKEADKAGVKEKLVPLLNFAGKYFSIRSDVIQDGWGLYGLIDDAYLVHHLIQSFSDLYEGQTGKALLLVRTSDANQFVRTLIGEPDASKLDGIVKEGLNGTDVMNCLRVLVGSNADFGNVPDPTWEDPKSMSENIKFHMTTIGEPNT
ncbi:MAG: hypothetical protein ACI9S8_003139 [Chlamydiales bacterium]|jgi:hypothetical protein